MANVDYGIQRLQIDARYTNSSHTCLTGSGDDCFKIFSELFAVQMTVGIYELH
jgi:hypothetical protein